MQKKRFDTAVSQAVADSMDTGFLKTRIYIFSGESPSVVWIPKRRNCGARAKKMSSVIFTLENQTTGKQSQVRLMNRTILLLVICYVHSL